MIVNLIFEGFISIWYNILEPILGGIILIEMKIEVPIIWEKACITLSWGHVDFSSKNWLISTCLESHPSLKGN